MDNIITYQKAIRTLKMEMLGDSEQMKYAKQTAIEALEKQIPKELKATKVGQFGLVLLCPSCENEMAMIYNSVWQKGRYKQKYCDNCGQALDFGDLNGIY